MLGGTFSAIGNVRMRGEVWVLILFVIQAIARGRLVSLIPNAGQLAILVWLLSSSAIMVLLLLNRSVRGLLIVAGGLALNLTVVLANGAMPVAVVSSNSSGKALPPMYEPIDAATKLPWLADVVSLRLWNAQYLISAGDILLAFGAAVFVVVAMRSRTGGPSDLGEDDE